MKRPPSLPTTRHEADSPSLPPPLPLSSPSPPPAQAHSPPSAAGPPTTAAAAAACSTNSPSALIIKAMLGNDDDDDSDSDSLSEEGGLGGGRKGRRRKQHPTLGGKPHSSSQGPQAPAQPSLQTILRQAQPPSIRTGQFHRQQEVKMQSIRGLLLASLSINLVCGFMLATMTGTTKRREEMREGGREGREKFVACLVVDQPGVWLYVGYYDR